MSLLDRRKLFLGYKANRRRREPPIVASCPICPWRSRPCSPKKAEARYQIHVALRHAVAWLFAALLLFACVASAQEQPRIYRVPFHTVNGMVLLDATVNGQPAVMLLDPGANQSIVSVGASGLSVNVKIDLRLEKRHWLERSIVAINLSDASKRLSARIDGFLDADLLQEFSAVRIDFAITFLNWRQHNEALCDPAFVRSVLTCGDSNTGSRAVQSVHGNCERPIFRPGRFAPNARSPLRFPKRYKHAGSELQRSCLQSTQPESCDFYDGRTSDDLGQQWQLFQVCALLIEH